MNRARDIREQIEGLCERVELEVTSNPTDIDIVTKAITSGSIFPSIGRCLLLDYTNHEYS
jgi:pre-mRNA-splicing factor ATP-dependent RNA helicase DHX16